MRRRGFFLLAVTVTAAISSIFSPIAFAAGPAGVESGLEFWFSADSGAKDSGGNAAADNEQIETWEDQSANNRDATRSAGSAVYSENGLNFNPTLNFTDGRYQASDTGLVSGSGDRSIFVVASADSGGWRYVLGAGTFGGGAGFDFGHNSNSASVFITTHSSQEAITGSWTPYGTARLAYGAVNGGPLYIAVNGSVPVQGSGGNVNTSLSGSVKIGSNSRGDEYWDGNISEVIYYDRLVTATERQRINSYLALKYGFSLDQGTAQSYLASGSNLMWDKDAADASTYDNDLFGIGRDDASNLSQIKSRGQNSTTVITVEAVNEGTNLVPDFEDMDDLEFLVFGDNGGAASWTTTGAPSGYSILERKWKKQEQGDVGFVRMDFNVANSNMNIPDTLDGGVYYFVYDSDNDGSLSDEVPQGMSDQGGDAWRVAVDFGAGGLFTLASTENPAAEGLSPVDNAVGVNGNTNLVITLSTSVTVGTGDILIKKASDNSIVETIPVGSGQVSGSGTDTITINPANSLDDGIEYYVQIPSTAFKDADDDYFPGITNATGWSFTTADSSAPVISSVTASSTASSSAGVAWATNEAASTRVAFGLTSAYGSTTPESNTSPRVTSHSVSLSPLAACAIYHYATVSSDAAGNVATSTDATFTTAGCEYSSAPTQATSASITSSSGGVSTMQEGGKTFTVSLPANVTATSSSLVIQVKAVPSDNVLGMIGRPDAKPNEVGATVFDVKAVINGTTILDSFDHPVTISYEYTDSEISNISESSLWLYHYSNGAWSALDSCDVDTAGNRIECTAPHFSIFALFGSQAQSSNNRSGSSVQSLVANLIAMGRTAEADVLKKQWAHLFFQSSAASVPQGSCAPYMKGYVAYGGQNDPSEVRRLEEFLNDTQGESLSVDGVYSPADVEAVKRFQKKYKTEVLLIWGISEPTGYVYRTTLLKINSIKCAQTSECPAFTEYNSVSVNPRSTEVSRAKSLLSGLGFYSGAIDISFDTGFEASLGRFQEEFSDAMLKPWNLSEGTGYKYKTTNKFLNMLVGCKTGAVELDGKGSFDY
ncbi:MAG TPA: Ig-like domain-containing protein [Candidatus Paceibacterota bacterium]